MDNHEEEKESLIAQSRAGEAGANLTDVLERMTALIVEVADLPLGPAGYCSNPLGDIVEEAKAILRSNVELRGRAL